MAEELEVPTMRWIERPRINEIDLSKKMQIHSVFHVFMLQCCNQFILPQIIETPVKPDEKYQVENILEQQMISEKTHYLVK